MEWFSSPILPTDPDEHSPVLSNPSLQTRYEGSAVCWELKCHFSYVPFHRSRRWPVTDHVYRARLTRLSENCMFFLTGSPWHFLINFDLTGQGSNLSVKERWESVQQVLTNCKGQISGMLQDMLNSCGIQFYCFNLKCSMRTRSQRVFFPSPEKCFWSVLCNAMTKGYSTSSRENGQSYNSSPYTFPWYSLCVCSPAQIMSEMALAWK